MIERDEGLRLGPCFADLAALAAEDADLSVLKRPLEVHGQAIAGDGGAMEVGSEPDFFRFADRARVWPVGDEELPAVLRLPAVIEFLACRRDPRIHLVVS